MPVFASSDVITLIESHAEPITGADTDYDALMQLIGDADFVLLGEATHGSHDFYRARLELSRRLITEKHFSAIAVEADWPDAYRVNRYVQGSGKDRSAEEALGDFQRFPLWMWRNLDVVELIHWLREHNDPLPPEGRIGFYGLDLYSLNASIDAVVRYLDCVDPAAAGRARKRYGCFEDFGADPQEYGMAASLGLTPDCEDAAIEQLVDLRVHALEYLRHDGFAAADELFYAEQNARLVENAARYYREMFGGRVSTWNLRDRHMTETLVSLADHLSRTRGDKAKVIVWAHNSHIGDARMTDMGRDGELNIGQLVRERYGKAVRLIGFTTYSGTVSAASNWGEPVQRMQIRPALEGSVEALFHECALPAFELSLLTPHVREALQQAMLERAIGVVYRPQTERVSHYFMCRVIDQFDAILHFDRTRALDPLDVTPAPEREKLPETFPTGL